MHFKLPENGTWKKFSSGEDDELSGSSNFNLGYFRYKEGSGLINYSCYSCYSCMDVETGSIGNGEKEFYCWSSSPAKALYGYKKGFFVFAETKIKSSLECKRANAYYVYCIEE